MAHHPIIFPPGIGFGILINSITKGDATELTRARFSQVKRLTRFCALSPFPGWKYHASEDVPGLTPFTRSYLT